MKKQQNLLGGARSKARVDAVLALLSIVFVTALEIWLDVGERFFEWAARHEQIEADEMPFILLWVATASIWFALRRFNDVRTESNEREKELAARERVEVQLRKTQDELEKRVEERTRQIEKEVAVRLKTEEQLRSQQAALAHINRLSTSSEMVSALAHELNQPLFALNSYAQGCVELLKSGDDKTEEVLGAVTQILEQSKRATRNINWIREFVEKHEPRAVAIDINEVVGDVVELLTAEGRNHGVAFDVDLADPLPKVMLDPIQMQQVLVNLAANGMAAMSEWGPVDRRLKIHTIDHGGDAVEVQVQDSGPGLNGELLEKVFEPFYTTKDSGLGMGLSICRSIATAFGGRLWATSDGLTGTTFHVWLPTAAGDELNGP